MSFDFDAAVVAPFRMQPGLRRMPPDSLHLTPSALASTGGRDHADGRSTRHLHEKLAVLWAYPWQALLLRPSFNPDPALDALARHAATEHPLAWQCRPNEWIALLLGHGVDVDGQVIQNNSAWPEVGALLRQLPIQWRRAALLCLAFEEDFAIVDASDGSIPWLAVALPSGWAPEHKVGRHIAEVHAPVADNRLIVQASEHLLRLVTGQARWERFVWTLTPHPRLHAHPDRIDPQRWPTAASADDLATLAWWRTERQTFIPVPGLQQAIFTIRVNTQSLATAINTANRAQRVHQALLSMSDAVLHYRHLSAVRAGLLEWLAQRADPALGRP